MAHLGDFDRLYGSRTLSYVVGVKHPLSWLASATRFWGIAANASLLEARSSTLLGLLRTWNAYHAKWIELIEHDGGRHHAALLQYERRLADPAAAVRELGRRLGWRPHPNPGSRGLPTTQGCYHCCCAARRAAAIAAAWRTATTFTAVFSTASPTAAPRPTSLLAGDWPWHVDSLISESTKYGWIYINTQSG